jgi:Holliday junction resolvase RusA-like endonuclease
MLTLKFPFIPPTANHAQKHRLMGRKIVRYNTPQYNAFKADVERHLDELNEATRAELVAILNAPHAVFMTIASPKFKTKKGEWSLTGGDVDNRIKQQLDSIYKPLNANDALIIIIGAKKKADDEEYTIITFTPYAEGL